MTLLMKLLLVVIVAVLTVIINNFKKPAEQKEKEKNREADNRYIDAINNDSTGYELPPGTADKWGDKITTETRMESGQTDGVKRPDGTS